MLSLAARIGFTWEGGLIRAVAYVLAFCADGFGAVAVAGGAGGGSCVKFFEGGLDVTVYFVFCIFN